MRRIRSRLGQSAIALRGFPQLRLCAGPALELDFVWRQTGCACSQLTLENGKQLVSLSESEPAGSELAAPQLEEQALAKKARDFAMGRQSPASLEGSSTPDRCPADGGSVAFQSRQSIPRPQQLRPSGRLIHEETASGASLRWCELAGMTRVAEGAPGRLLPGNRCRWPDVRRHGPARGLLETARRRR